MVIVVRDIGQHFACYAAVKRGKDVLHLTRDYPFGMRNVAFAAAEAWVHANNLSLAEEG